MVMHNLPEQPYKKFFGRKNSIGKIKETLLEGGTFIASIDGVGGIGKTALAYYFCKEIILPSNSFDNIIWISAKETTFDPFSVNKMIKKIDNKFMGIKTLIDTTLSTIGFEEVVDEPLNIKKELFEEFLKSENVLIVLDNLENVDDEEFFRYIKKDFNKFAAENRNLKVLTTSRKRKKLIDNPIEIEGLAIEDALKMLKYLAAEYDIKDILNASDHDNLILVEKVGKIPLGIEFIIGQMSKGKNRGQIYQELDGYPSLEGVHDERSRKKILSDIILFSFQNMYETLSVKEKKIFQIIAAFQKNKTANDPDISVELLLSMANMSKYDIESALEVLIENKLVTSLGNNSYGISPMAISFVRQYYDNFEEIEEEVVGKKRILLRGINSNNKDKIDILINDVRNLLEENKYEEAEQKLLKVLDLNRDYRIYYELAKVQRILNKFSRASDNYKMATNLNSKNPKIWYDWVNMEDNRGRYNIALNIIDQALAKTNNDVSIVLQKVNILKYLNKFKELRNLINEKLTFYRKEGRKEDFLRLLRNWKNIEYRFLKEGKESNYFSVVEKLINNEEEKEIKLQLLGEELKMAVKMGKRSDVIQIRSEIRKIEKSIIRSINGRIRNLNNLFNSRKYKEAKKEARKILNWVYDDEENKKYAKNALRVLLQILSSENEYDRIILTFEDYKEIGYLDKNCEDIYTKAKKEKENIIKKNIIDNILFNIQQIETNLREIVMWALDYDENELEMLIKSKGKEKWIEQWELTRNKSLKDSLNLLYYSDLSHLRSILSWVRPIIIRKLQYHKYDIKNILKHIVAYLEDYISAERNEAYHSRLQLFTAKELDYILLDTKKMLDLTNKFKNICFNE